MSQKLRPDHDDRYSTFLSENVGQSRTSKTGKPMSDGAKRDAQRIVAFGRMDNRTAKATYGPTYRGILQHVMHDGRMTYHKHVRPIIKAGFVVGYRFKLGENSYEIDYRKRAIPGNATVIWQPPNQNIARRVKKPAEDLLAKALARPDRRYAAVLGLKPGKNKISMRAASRIATALITEAIINTVPASSDGNLAVLRTLPPSIRGHYAKRVLAGTKRSDQLRDLLHQCPVLACWPGVLTSSKGLSPKRILPEIGLPKSASRIRAGAIAPLVHWNRVHKRDADRDIDIGWMTDELCRALPERMAPQRSLFDLLCRLTLRHTFGREVEQIGLWALNSGLREMQPGEMNLEANRFLIDYLLADRAVLSRLGIRPWSNEIGLRRTLETARSSNDAVRQLQDGDDTPFTRPAWAPPDCELPQSLWQARWLGSPQALIREGHQGDNCVGGYADVARRGISAIYTIRRPARSYDPPRIVVEGEVVGGTIELVPHHGTMMVAQLESPGNAPPLKTVRQAVDRWIAPRKAAHAE